jgi:hypothetical protein
MDGNSVYSKVGHKKHKGDFSKINKFGKRKESILDAFEAVANESQEEILGRTSD